MITRNDVLAAQERTRGRVRRTPVMAVDPDLSDVWLKCEFLQYTGVFKTRGAFNRIIAAQERGELDLGTGIVAASGGNAGLAYAFAASRLGITATVFVPQAAPAVKVVRLRQYGAKVFQVGRYYSDAYEAAVNYADAARAVFCHAYDQLEVAAGAGTTAEEILDDIAGVDTIVVAVGGGGLFAGVSAAAAGRARVVAVEPSLIPTLHSALAAGYPVDVDVSGVAADSLGARRIGDIAFHVARKTGPISVLVDDDAITAARHALWDGYRIAAEHGAATAWAALTTGAYRPESGERVAVIICGANTDPRSLDG